MSHDADGGGMPRADVIPLQPMPVNYQVVYSDRKGEIETSIARAWRLEDVERCRLCRQCTATIGDTGKTALCLKVAKWRVPEAEVPLFLDPSELSGSDGRHPGTATG